MDPADRQAARESQSRKPIGESPRAHPASRQPLQSEMDRGEPMDVAYVVDWFVCEYVAAV